MITPKGLAKTCRHSYPTNKKNYCGPHNAFNDFYLFIKSPKPQAVEGIIAQVRGFPILYSYFSQIGEKLGVEPLDEQVIEAYWSPSKKALFEKKEAEKFVSEKLVACGLAQERLFGISKKIPVQTSLSHAFHVLCVNFITNKVEKTPQNYSNCLVLPAKIIEEKNGGFFVQANRLSDDGKKFVLVEQEITNPFGLQAGTGDFVSVHWNTAIENVTRKNGDRLIEEAKNFL